MKQMQSRVLYFTKAAKPTDREVAKAQSISPNIGFRYAAGAKIAAIEKCDAVAGQGVPMIYHESGIPYVNTAAELRNAVLSKGRPQETDPDLETDPDAEAPALDPAAGPEKTADLGGWGNGNGGTDQT